MSLNRKKIKGSLSNKGFTGKPDGRHIKFVLRRDDLNDKIVTHVSHGGGKTISDKLTSDMARQCKIKTSQFRDLVDCRMSGDDYINVLASSDKQKEDR